MLLAPYALADIYQWQDVDGSIYYGDRPPVAVPAKLMKDAKTMEAENLLFGIKNERLEQQKLLIEQYSKEREEQGAANAKALVSRKSREAQCQKLKGVLQSRESVNVLYRKDKEGRRIYLSDEERRQSDLELKQAIAQLCKD